MSNRNDTDDGLGVTLQVLLWIVASVLLFCCILGIRSTVRANQPGPCQETAFAGEYWANPVTKECGIYFDGGLYGSRESCPAIMKLKAFDGARHCWAVSK